jgi:hypothetical protein
LCISITQLFYKKCTFCLFGLAFAAGAIGLAEVGSKSLRVELAPFFFILKSPARS